MMSSVEYIANRIIYPMNAFLYAVEK